MKFVNVILLFIINLHIVEGFYIDSDSSEGIDFFPYLPKMYATGTCYFLANKHYNIGDLQFFIYSDNPTINLYSPHYLTFSRRLHGMKYRMVNLKEVDPGLMCVKYTFSYIGWIRPQTWCSDILPYVPTTTTDETTARPTTTVLPQTFDPITQASSTPSTPTFDPSTSISTETIPTDKTTEHAITTTLKQTFDPTASTSTEEIPTDKTTEHAITTTLKPTFHPTTSSPLPTSVVSTTISTSVPSPTTTSKIPTTPPTTSPSVPTTTLGTRKPLPDPSR